MFDEALESVERKVPEVLFRRTRPGRQLHVDVGAYSTALDVPLIETLDACLEEEWAVPLALHLGAGRDGEELDLRRGRRFAVARRLAGLFASYAVQRPALLADWHTGGSGDGCGRALPEDLAWQPHLWRRLAERVVAPPPHLRHELRITRGGRTSTETVPGEPTYRHQLRAFVTACLDGAPVITTAAEGAATMRVIDAIYTAAGLPLRG